MLITGKYKTSVITCDQGIAGFLMRNLDSTVQQNDRLVDKVAEASCTLERRAYGLAELMGRFRLESDQAAPEHRSAQNDDTGQAVPISIAANK